MVWFYINEHSISTRFTTNVMRIWLPQSTATEGFYLDYGGAKNWYIVCQHCSSIKYKYLLLHPTSIFHKFDGVAVVPGSGPGGILGSDLSRQPGSLLAQPLLQRGSEAVVGMRSTSRPAPQPPLSQPQHHHQSCVVVVVVVVVVVIWDEVQLHSLRSVCLSASTWQHRHQSMQCSHEAESKYCTGGG